MSNDKNSIFLRSSLDFDATKRNNLISFSPDIIPLYQTKITDAEQLISTYGAFSAQTVVAEEKNLVYVRGAATDVTASAKTTITVGSVTNELILWPQVLNAAQAIGKRVLSYTPPQDVAGTDTPGVVASIKPLAYTPPGRGGRHDTFVAVSDNSFGKFKIAANYKDLVNNIGAAGSIALLNAVVADPIFDVYSLSTRLRFFDDGTAPVTLELELESVGIPSGYSVSVFSDNPKIALAKTAIDSSTRIGFTVPATDGLDAQITVQIFKSDGAAILPNSSSISLVAYVETGSGHVVDTVILGAEHVVFDSAIRISKAFVQGDVVSDTVAQGFYFRDQIGDTDQLPRAGAGSHSPDIQPLGTTPVSNIGGVLSTATYNTDVSDQWGATSNIVSKAPNYIYLRGATNAAVHVEFSLYAIPSSLVITPEMYGPYGITELDVNNDTVLAVRELIAKGPGIQTITTPFNWLNPPPVTEVNPNSDHYCLIAEYRAWAKDPIDKDLWPHQKGLPTGADLALWVLSNPAVAWRNVAWTSNPNAPTEIWQVDCAVPSNWSATDVGYLTIVCSNMPTGGFMAFSATKAVAGQILEISQTLISNPAQSAGVQFTGLSGPWDTTITVQWWQGSGAPRAPGATIQMQLQLVVPGTGMAAMVLGKKGTVSDAQGQWPLIVGKDYPHLQDKLDSDKRKLLLGSSHPMPRIKAAGRFEQAPDNLVRPTKLVVIGGDCKGVPYAG